MAIVLMSFVVSRVISLSEHVLTRWPPPIPSAVGTLLGKTLGLPMYASTRMDVSTSAVCGRYGRREPL